MSELPEHRLKRLYMRSIRRGIKEMDLILQHYAKEMLPKMSADQLDVYEAFLAENDQDLYPWINGQTVGPTQYSALIDDIRSVSVGIVAPQ